MEVENCLFDDDFPLQTGGVIHFHVMCSSECIQMKKGTRLNLFMEERRLVLKEEIGQIDLTTFIVGAILAPKLSKMQGVFVEKQLGLHKQSWANLVCGVTESCVHIVAKGVQSSQGTDASNMSFPGFHLFRKKLCDCREMWSHVPTPPKNRTTTR